MGIDIELGEYVDASYAEPQTVTVDEEAADVIKSPKRELAELASEYGGRLNSEQYAQLIPRFKSAVERIMGFIESTDIANSLRFEGEDSELTLHKAFVSAMDDYVALLFARRYDKPISVGDKIRSDDVPEDELLRGKEYVTNGYGGFSSHYSTSYTWFKILKKVALPEAIELSDLAWENRKDEDTSRLTPQQCSLFVPKIGAGFRRIMDQIENEEEGIITYIHDDLESEDRKGWPVGMTLEGAFTGALEIYTTLLSTQEDGCELLLR